MFNSLNIRFALKMKHARIARELKVSQELESKLGRQCKSLHMAAEDVATMYKGRLRYSQHLAKDLSDRLQNALNRLDASVPHQVQEQVHHFLAKTLFQCNQHMVTNFLVFAFSILSG